jgi:hypothetical protein
LKPKIPTWVNLSGPRNENVGIVCGRLEYITTIWYILWPFGNLLVIWYIFYPPFWYIVSQKIRQPWRAHNFCVFFETVEKWRQKMARPFLTD